MIPRISKIILAGGLVLGVCAIGLALWGGSDFKWTSPPSDSTVRTIEIKVCVGENGEVQMLGATAIIALVIGSALFAYSKQGPAGESAGLRSDAAGFSFFAFVQNLRKSAKDSKIGGVCGGLGEHSPVPSWVWRMLFMVFAVCFEIGVLAYVILWICMPGASSPKTGGPGTGGKALI